MKAYKNLAYVQDCKLIDAATPTRFKANPTLAVGDVKVAGTLGTGNMGSYVNIGTLPTIQPAAGINVHALLSTAEMNYDRIDLWFLDAAGNEWMEVLYHIDTEEPRFVKNQAFNDFPFLMVLSSDHVAPFTGAATATRMIDNAAFSACANSPAHVANGAHRINLAASDLNGTAITFRFTGSGADDRFITVTTVF